MKFITEDKNKRIIRGQEEITFSSLTSYHLIILTARAKGEKQISQSSTDDEDLTLQIDDKKFSPPANISGGRLHGLSKTVYLLTFLQGRDHKLILNADDPPGTATFEKLEIYIFNPVDILTLESKIQAEDGDRRAWLAFVMDDLPLKDISITVTYSRRKRDSDDIKVKIDGQIQENLLRNIKHLLWYFAGLLISWIAPTRTESQSFSTSFSSGFHYIEIDADRMPTLERVTFNFGSGLPAQKSIPTVDNPGWTGSFSDDTEEILLARLILGETEGQPKEAKIGVGFTVLNRLKKKNPNWGLSIREIILKKNQYDGMWNKDTYQKVRDPLNDNSKERLQEWHESYEVVTGVLSGNLSDFSNGATNFHSFKDPRNFPGWATKEAFRIKLGNIYFYELEK